MCKCYPDATPRQNLVLLAAWAKNNPGCVPRCARCDKPFDLTNAYEVIGIEGPNE